MNRKRICMLLTAIMVTGYSGNAHAALTAGAIEKISHRNTLLTAGATAMLSSMVSDALSEKGPITIEPTVNVTGSTEIGIPSEPAEEDIPVDTDIEYEDIMNRPDNVPNEAAGCSSWKFCYERRTALKNTETPQYQLCYGKASPDENGFLKVDDRFVIAVGTAYADKVGDKVDVLYEDGTMMKAIVGDFKSDRHTDSSHRFHLGWYGSDDGRIVLSASDAAATGMGWHQGDESVIEFIIDPGTFKKNPPFFVYKENRVMKVYKVGDAE